MAISRILLSGSSYGEPISVSTTVSGSAVTIHQASTATANVIDEVYLAAVNNGAASHVIYLVIAGSTSPVAGSVSPSASDTPVVLLAGNCIKSSTAAAKSIVAYGTTSLNLAVYGYVNRIAT